MIYIQIRFKLFLRITSYAAIPLVQIFDRSIYELEGMKLGKKIVHFAKKVM